MNGGNSIMSMEENITTFRDILPVSGTDNSSVLPPSITTQGDVSSTDGTSIQVLGQKYITYIIAVSVHKYWLITVCCAGVLGNILSFKIMSQVSKQFM